MAVVAAWRTGPAALLAAGAWWFGGGENGSLVRRMSWSGFRLAAKELAFPQAKLGADVFEFGLKFRETGASALMHGLPVTGLLAEIEVFSKQRAGVAAWRCGRVRTLDLRGRGRGWTRVRCNIHTTSMIGTQLQGEVSRRRRTRLPKSYLASTTRPARARRWASSTAATPWAMWCVPWSSPTSRISRASTS